MIESGKATFYAGAELDRYRRVKLKAGSTTSPPEVEYAGAGELHIGITDAWASLGDTLAVRLLNQPGTMKVVAAKAIAAFAVLYGAVDGKVSDAAVGSAIGIAKTAAGQDGIILEMVPYNVLSTAAGTVSLADAGGFFDGATVEAALAEIGQHLLSPQRVVPVPLTAFTREDGTPLAKFSDGASTIPGFSQEASGELMLRWNNHATPVRVIFQVPLPNALDEAADLEIHFKAAATDTNDTPVMDMAAFIDGSADVAGAGPEVLDNVMTEYVMTIAAADVPAGARLLTVAMGPTAGELGADDLLLSAPWLEIKPVLLDS
jgi:hypothetical protein